MKGSSFRYLVDACLFVVLSATAVVGLLLAFVLRRGPNGSKYFLGVHRHDWADIHFYLSIVFVALLVLHLLLSWRWVVASSKRLLGGQRWKHRLGLLSCAWLLLLFVAWLFAYC